MFTLPKEVTERIERLSSHFYKIMKSSLQIKKEPLLIITDYGFETRNLSMMIAYGYYTAAKVKNLHVNVAFQDIKKGFMASDFNVVKALELLPEKSIIILAVSNKLGKIGTEKSFRTFCKERKHRFLSATGLADVTPQTFDFFVEAMSVPTKRLKKVGLAIKKKWDKAAELHVKTSAGTDLLIDISSKEAVANIAEYHEPGRGGNMPAGEVYIAPNNLTKVNGTLVIDGSLRTDEGSFLVDEPLVITIKEGRIIHLEGKYAELVEKTLQRFEHRAKYPERIRILSEIAIGINPAAVLLGSMIIDEKVKGTGHVAFGSNHWFGGDIKTIYHGDMVFKNPTFYVDGVKME